MEVLRGPCSPEKAPERPLLCLSQLLAAAGFPRLVALSLQSLPPPSYGLLPVFLCVSLLRTPVIGFRAHSKSRILSSQDTPLITNYLAHL